jgi:glyoxylase-like metal-dependent hydrolase (beta-lactamase superfamily II)
MIHTIDLHFQGIENAIASFLVETSEGPVIIETGPHSTFPYLKKGIENLGYSLTDIKHVFLSHIHFDHAGAAWAFAELGANIYLHPVGAPHLAEPSRLWNSAKRIYQDQMEILWGEMRPINQERLRVVNHEEQITIGDTSFKSWHTPGHAIHHIAWQMGDNLFAGDVAGVKIGNGLVVPPCPPPDINLEDWVNSIDLIRSIDIKYIYLTHYGKIEMIKEHLDSLEFCLNDWAQWIKPYAIENADIPEITPKFQTYVAKQLKDFGLTQNGILQYEAANPSWMSVSGLMRYWSKKLK